MSACPCLCGHAWHTGPCPTCRCPVASPDYVAQATAELPPGTDVKARLVVVFLDRCKASQESVARQLGYMGPPKRGAAAPITLRCDYCGFEFRSQRAHAETCSTACRQARSIAFKFRTDADVPSPPFRHDTYSEERYSATGFGGMSAQESYDADIAVRARERARRAAKKAENETQPGE